MKPQSLLRASPARLRTPHFGLQSIQNQCFRRSPNVYPTFTRTSLHNFAENRNRRPNSNLALAQRLADVCLALSARKPAARWQLLSEAWPDSTAQGSPQRTEPVGLDATLQSLPRASPTRLRTLHLGVQSIQNQCFRHSPNVYLTFTRTSPRNFAESRN